MDSSESRSSISLESFKVFLLLKDFKKMDGEVITVTGCESAYFNDTFKVWLMPNGKVKVNTNDFYDTSSGYVSYALAIAYINKMEDNHAKKNDKTRI